MADGEGLPAMDLFRSEPMQLARVIIPMESAHRAISYLGELGLFQFKDLNGGKSPFQRTYATQIKRCGEMARKLRFFRDQMYKAGVSASKLSYGSVITLDELEVKLGELEFELIEMNANSEKLEHAYNELLEYRLVLKKMGEVFNSAQKKAMTQHREQEHRRVEGSIDSPLLLEQEITNDMAKQVKLGFVSGLVPRDKSMAFERILFRATRGNVFLKQDTVAEPVIDPVSGQKVEKNVFIVFHSGERAKSKVLKICDAFGANRYPFNDDMGKQHQMMEEVAGKLSELKTTIDVGQHHWSSVVQAISDQYEQWKNMVKKEKSIYHTLNMLSFDVTKKCLVAEGWCPVFAKNQIQKTLLQATTDSNSKIGAIFEILHTKEAPPTYFCTNKFTSAFQEILVGDDVADDVASTSAKTDVDATSTTQLSFADISATWTPHHHPLTGVAKYQEANPGVYTVVTFPFLFAVMFGDWGHGICLFLATLILILREKTYSSRKLGDIMEMAFGGRYVIIMMSIFSIYTGFIYNECFSVPFELFGPSAYDCRDSSCRDATTTGLIKVRNTYPFGVDPVWHGTRSELPFLNSLKMKMSILLGVAQMNLGIILSYFNGKFFRNDIDIWYQFVPQMIFLNCLFGYLSLLIIVKWCTGSQADLYHVMIYMFLSPMDDLDDNQLFFGQKYLQLLLLFLALVAVPWMLVPKPFLLKKQHEERHNGEAYLPLGGDENLSPVMTDGSHGGHEEFQFSEVLVHQLIHTIEFVLGSVSNTASYLRLWALSLAHSELSKVFYEKVLVLAWGYDSVVILIIGAIVFIFATVGVLLVMETLSAFLHALRLHWVEFQNKFYEGNGYIFDPFSFALIRDDEE